MDDTIIISNLNDFIFCPASIYFHNLYGNQSTITYQGEAQIKGTKAHETVDQDRYSTKKAILTSLEVYSEKYNVVGKIDIYNQEIKALIERKKVVKQIYDGYVFQLYAQYFGMIEMGYEVENLYLYSMADHKKYAVRLPVENPEMFKEFEVLIKKMRNFDLEGFKQTNSKKCENCIYEPACDRSLV